LWHNNAGAAVPQTLHLAIYYAAKVDSISAYTWHEPSHPSAKPPVKKEKKPLHEHERGYCIGMSLHNICADVSRMKVC
jgi:hypothetical protein